jgi:hypothetical protein
MLRVLLEGTPASFPVDTTYYWEAGMVGAILNSTSAGSVGPATGAAAGSTGSPIGILADRRSTITGMSNAAFLPTSVGSYGDESLFNQPGWGNSLYGTTAETVGGSSASVTINNVIPANTIPTTTLLNDETKPSGYVTVYIRGGLYATDMYASAITSSTTAGVLLYSDANGLLTTSSNGPVVGVVTAPIDGNGFLQFKLTLV